MTIEEAVKKVQNIWELRYDNEAAHAKEDDLFHEFVQYVASLNIPISIIAEEILKTEDMDFARWYA